MGFTAGRFTKYHEEPKSPILDDPAKANICMYVEDIINLGSGKGALRACRERLSCKGDRSEMVQTAKAHKILEKNFEYIF